MRLYIIILPLVFIIFLDSSAIRISDLTGNFLTSDSWKYIFLTTAVIYSFGQYFVLRSIGSKNRLPKETGRLSLTKIKIGVEITQIFLNIVLFLLILQIFVRSEYDISLLLLSVTISYGLGAALMLYLALRFFLWTKSYKSVLVAVYGISAGSICWYLIITALFVDTILSYKPSQITSHLQTSFFIIPRTFLGNLDQVFVVSSILSFTITWIATALLLRYYSYRMGRFKYWAVISLPLLYYLSQYLTAVFPVVIYSAITSEVLLTIFFSLTKTIGGIVFGIAFWTLSKYLPTKGPLREYTRTCAYGLLLLFISDQAIIVSSAFYPPFGLVSTLILGLSAYLVLVGIYSSALSVAQDSNLRTTIRNHVLAQTEFLDKIGLAQMNREIENRVIGITESLSHTMAQETGVEPTLHGEDLKGYLEEVMKEISAQKEHKRSRS